MLTIALVIGGAFTNVYAYQSPPYPFPPTFPVNYFDFILSTSATLIKIQQGQTGGLVVYANQFCPNSTATIKCDSTVMQTVSFSISGCPGGAFCIISPQEILIPPLSQGSTNLIVYTFFGGSVSSGPVLMTVTGVDQFGNTHSVTFGVVVCYC